jgi:hypothetical protein
MNLENLRLVLASLKNPSSAHHQYAIELVRKAINEYVVHGETCPPVGEVAPSQDGSGQITVKWSTSPMLRNLMYGDLLYAQMPWDAKFRREVVEELERLGWRLSGTDGVEHPAYGRYPTWMDATLACVRVACEGGGE